MWVSAPKQQPMTPKVVGNIDSSSETFSDSCIFFDNQKVEFVDYLPKINTIYSLGSCNKLPTVTAQKGKFASTKPIEKDNTSQQYAHLSNSDKASENGREIFNNKPNDSVFYENLDAEHDGLTHSYRTTEYMLTLDDLEDSERADTST